MGLINLQTNLKSLRFGNDRVHSGNSGQPYIQSPIPEGDTSVLPSQDFILRGGLYTARDSAEDVVRLGKYFTDLRNPSGLLFVAKQNLLSRTAVRTQASTGLLNEGAYTPLSTLAQASVSAFGLHFNKQGLNPIPGTLGSLVTYFDKINEIKKQIAIEEEKMAAVGGKLTAQEKALSESIKQQKEALANDLGAFVNGKVEDVRKAVLRAAAVGSCAAILTSRSGQPA